VQGTSDICKGSSACKDLQEFITDRKLSTRWQKAKEEPRESTKWSLASDCVNSSTLEGHSRGRIRSVESLKSSVLLYLIRVPRITSGEHGRGAG